MDMSYSVFAGLPGRCNNILFSCPLKPIQNVVFFQGDIQVYTITMSSCCCCYCCCYYCCCDRILTRIWRKEMKKSVAGKNGVLKKLIVFYKESSQVQPSLLSDQQTCCEIFSVVIIILSNHQ